MNAGTKPFVPRTDGKEVKVEAELLDAVAAKKAELTAAAAAAAGGLLLLTLIPSLFRVCVCVCVRACVRADTSDIHTQQQKMELKRMEATRR